MSRRVRAGHGHDRSAGGQGTYVAAARRLSPVRRLRHRRPAGRAELTRRGAELTRVAGDARGGLGGCRGPSLWPCSVSVFVSVPVSDSRLCGVEHRWQRMQGGCFSHTWWTVLSLPGWHVGMAQVLQSEPFGSAPSRHSGNLVTTKPLPCSRWLPGSRSPSVRRCSVSAAAPPSPATRGAQPAGRRAANAARRAGRLGRGGVERRGRVSSGASVRVTHRTTGQSAEATAAQTAPSTSASGLATRRIRGDSERRQDLSGRRRLPKYSR